MTEQELALALTVLSRGGVIAAATETFFGLLGDARRADTLDQVLSLKGRDAAKGIALILPDRAAWDSMVDEIPAVAALLADWFWPGPLTIALPARTTVDPKLTVDGNVAVRWPSASDASRIAAAFGHPLTATSANLTGQPAGATGGEVQAAFHEPVTAGELVIISGRAPGGQPSTLVQCAGDQVRVLRPGAVRDDRLLSALATTRFRLMS